MEEKIEEKEEKSILIIFFYAIIGGIIAGIFGFLKNNFLYIILGFFIGLIIGIIFYGISFLPKDQRKIIYLVIFLIFIGIVIFLFLTKFSTSTFSFISFISLGLKNLFSLFSCWMNPQECYYIGFDEKNITSPDFSLNIAYEDDYIKNNTIDMLVKIELINKKIENLTFYPYCEILDKNRIPLAVYDLQTYGKGNYFIFPKSSSLLSTSFRCKGKMSKETENLVIGFNFPYSSKLIWRIYTGTFQEIEDKKGKIIYKSEAPYVISIDFPTDMPLQNGKYEFFIKLKENPIYKFELRKINFFQITPFPPQDTKVICEEFGDKFENYGEEKLKEYYNEDKKEYIFNCKLFISNAPQDGIEERIINIIMDYIVYKELKKTVIERK